MLGCELAIKSADGTQLDATILEAPTVDRWAVLAHGISADKEEDGAFSRLAEDLLSANINSIRFSFRGHGASGGSSETMTVSGEMLDLASIFDFIAGKGANLVALIAASFGAVASSLLSDFLSQRVNQIVFWNPVTDLAKTFLSPTLPWGLRNFTGRNISRVYKDGYFYLDGAFKIGHVFWK